MNKNIILVGLFLLGVSFGLTAQTGKIKKADKSFEGYSYKKSLERFEGVTDKTPEMYRKMAASYFNVGDYDSAELNYAQLIATEEKTAEDVLNYAQVLKVNKKYALATQKMEEYKVMLASDTRVKDHLADKNYYEKLKVDAGRFKIDTLSINTKQEDFGPAFYKDQVVFASSREGVKSIRRKWNWNGLPFLNIYVADKGEDAQLSGAKQFKKSFNKKYHEGPVSFNEDGTYMVFTRNNYKEKSSDDVVKLQLFSSQLEEGDKWGEAKELHFNSNEYSVGHASLTKNAKKMYFASDMPGGIGGVDIYSVERSSDGTWGKTVNLGNKINTEGNEMFPFIHENGMLFFASNGKVGLGGLDVFVAQLKEDNSIGKVKNVGAPLNTNMDDFGFILDKEMKKGYFSSNRESGKGDDDIYSFELLKPFTFGKTIKGIAKDKNGSILADTKVSLYDEAGAVIETVTTSKDGAYSFTVEPDKKFKLDGVKSKYFDGNNTADTHTDEDVVYADLELEKDPGLSLYCLITDKASGTALEGVSIKLVNNVKGSEEDIVTPVTGDFMRPLSENKLNDRVSYNIVLEKDGYLAKTVTYNQLLDREGQYKIHEALNLTMDKMDVGMDLSKFIEINPIYFDYNKYAIRKDAAVELDKIVKVMNENPGMYVELGSHTDCRGSAKYNTRLSDKRAKASAKYIASKITTPERIFGKGYGESQLINHCACEGRVKSKCSDEEHQANRRTEFRITKMDTSIKVKNSSPQSFEKGK